MTVVSVTGHGEKVHCSNVFLLIFRISFLFFSLKFSKSVNLLLVFDTGTGNPPGWRVWVQRVWVGVLDFEPTLNPYPHGRVRSKCDSTYPNFKFQIYSTVSLFVLPFTQSSTMARDEVNTDLIVEGPRKRKLAAHITSEDNASADKDKTAKRLRHAGIGSFSEIIVVI